MKIFDCVDLRDKMENCITTYVNRCVELNIGRPYLTVISVGEDGASNSYVKSKENACARTGIMFYHMQLGKETSQEWLLRKVKEVNDNKLVDGLIVQFPIDSDKTISDEEVLNTISPEKDVDGLTPMSMGRLASNNHPIFIPCTAKGVVDILTKQHKMDLTSKHVVIIGKGKTSGRPLSLLLPNYGATVSVIDSKTSGATRKNLLETADIIISCTGRPNSINVYDICRFKPVTIINIGMNRVMGKLVGDVDLESFKDYEQKFEYDLNVTANTLTKSTGLMTVTNLLFNTCLAHLINQVPTEHFTELNNILKELY